MNGSGEEQRETIRPQFDRSVMIDFQGAKITSDTDFLLLRVIDERFGVLGPIENVLVDIRSWAHSKHTLLQLIRQRVYWMAAYRFDKLDKAELGIGTHPIAFLSKTSRICEAAE